MLSWAGRSKVPADMWALGRQSSNPIIHVSVWIITPAVKYLCQCNRKRLWAIKSSCNAVCKMSKLATLGLPRQENYDVSVFTLKLTLNENCSLKVSPDTVDDSTVSLLSWALVQRLQSGLHHCKATKANTLRDNISIRPILEKLLKSPHRQRGWRPPRQWSLPRTPRGRPSRKATTGRHSAGRVC